MTSYDGCPSAAWRTAMCGSFPPWACCSGVRSWPAIRTSQITIRVEERFLHDVPSQVEVRQPADRQPVGVVLVPPDQDGKGIPLSSQCIAPAAYCDSSFAIRRAPDCSNRDSSCSTIAGSSHSAAKKFSQPRSEYQPAMCDHE